MPNDCLLYSHVHIPTVTGLSGVPRVGIFKIGQLRAELRVDEADTVDGRMADYKAVFSVGWCDSRNYNISVLTFAFRRYATEIQPRWGFCL